MDFFKTVVDGQLINMEEASPEVEGLKGVTNDNPTSEAHVNEHKI